MRMSKNSKKCTLKGTFGSFKFEISLDLILVIIAVYIIFGDKIDFANLFTLLSKVK